MYFEAKKSMRTKKLGTKPNEKQHFQHVSNETIIIAWANNRMYVYIIIHFVKCVGEPHDFKPLSTCLMLFCFVLFFLVVKKLNRTQLLTIESFYRN